MGSKSFYFFFSSQGWLKLDEIHLLNVVFCIDEIQVIFSQRCSVYEDDTCEESCIVDRP